MLPELDRLLAYLGWRPAELDGIAVSIGPGSFTGLRVGLATVKGIAFAGGPPVVAVSSLAGLAEHADHTPGPVAALLDARRGEVYAGAWSEPRTEEADLLPESVYAPRELADRLPEGSSLVVGEGAAAVADAVLGLRPDLERREVRASAAAIARIALPRLDSGQGVAAEELVPRYLRRAEAEVQRTGRALE